MARLYTLFQERNHAQPFNSRNTHNKIFFPFGRTDTHPATPNFLIPVLSGMTIEPEIINLMALRQLSTRLHVDEVAKLLGFSADDIAIVAGDPKLLKALGSPAAAPKILVSQLHDDLPRSAQQGVALLTVTLKNRFFKKAHGSNRQLPRRAIRAAWRPD